MPSLQDIEQFKAYLNSLGNEPEILAQRGETIQDIKQPEAGLGEDLSDLFDQEAPLEEEEGLDILPEDFLEIPEASGEVPLPQPPEETMEDEGFAETEEGFDFGDLAEEAFEADEETSGEEEEDFFGLPEVEEEPLTEDEAFEIPSSEEDIGLSEESFELPPIEEAPEEEESFELPEEEEGSTEEDFSVPDLEGEEPGPGEEDDFVLPEFGEEEAFEIPEVGEEPPEEESFETPEFKEPVEEGSAEEESFGLPEFGEEGTGEGLEEEDLFGEESFEIPEAEEPPEGTASGEESFEIPEFGEEGAGEGPEEESFGDLEALDEEGFNLDFDELGDHFGITEEEAVPETAAVAPAAAEAEGVEDFHEGEEEYSLEDEEFDAVKATLNTLPRNLKLAVCELIGEKALGGERLRNLLGLLIAGASAREIAAQVSRITGKKIEIPAQYEKKTGVEFEAEKGTFAYAFKQNILPMLRIFVPALLGAALLLFVGIRFIYRPIKSWTLYKTGYEEMYQERYDSSEGYFDRAGEVWKFKKWYYHYAEGYIDRKEFYRAESTYLRLLQDFPEERQGRLDLAELQGMVLGKYEEAEAQLGVLLDEDRYDKDALLLLGDMNMQWALLDQSRYEHARKAYAGLISQYGQLDLYLFRMLRYFIRTDNYEEVIRLKERYEHNLKAEIDPVIYAEMGGYLIDKDELADVRDILFRAMDIDETVPEIHYNLARLFRENKDFTEEGKALDKAIHFLETGTARNPFREGMLIDSYIRKGERLYERAEYLDAEDYLIMARQHYENALRSRILSPEPEYGRLYARLGDIYYYQDGDFDTADVLYNLAEGNFYTTPDIDFKRGFIRYQREDFKEALLRFHDAGEGFSTNENLIFATANSLFERGDFFAAQGHYDHLIDILEQEKRNVYAFLLDERPDHRALIENLMKVYNNQGVTLYNLSLKTGNQSLIGEALYYFTESLELYDVLNRDPETLEAGQNVNLAYLNSRSILYPVGNYRLRIYRPIPRDMNELFF
ncbi:MAG: hypothetical protein JW760_14070 [Spirochaetales bacterium]|nr:hypothetical protein [Spirochaetales bacterium]